VYPLGRDVAGYSAELDRGEYVAVFSYVLAL
jgi:hypothetical protein